MFVLIGRVKKNRKYVKLTTLWKALDGFCGYWLELASLVETYMFDES